MDDGGDVVAGCDLGGSGGDGRVAAQFTFDAYGDVLTSDHIHAHAHLRCGHKGLFVDRLDVGVVTTSGVEQPRLVPSGHLLVHNRNRTYIPQMGRFLQQDPNATAAVLMESAASHGRGMAAMAAAFSMEQRYGDGGNLYEYLGSSPWSRSDPMGLSWDPFDMVDDYLAEDAGNKAAFMQEIMQGFNTVAHVAMQVAQLHPGVAIAVLGLRLITGQATLMDLLNALPVAGKAGNLIGHAFGSYWKGRAAMRAARKAGHFADDVYELHHVIPQFMTGWAKGRAVILTRAQHQQYHRILDDVLRESRLPVAENGTNAWRQFLLNNPERLHDVRAALVESVERFKSATNVDMMGDLVTEMTRQGFALLP